MNAGHLTDEQFSDLLAGDTPDAAAQSHLDICDHCRAEIAAVRSSVGEFNALSMAWARAEAPRRVHTPARWLLRLGARPAWGVGLAATAAACLLAVGLEHPFAHPFAHPAPQPAQATAPGPSTAELAADNRLLSSIDQELQYNAEPAVPVSELKADGDARQPRSAPPVAN